MKPKSPPFFLVLIVTTLLFLSAPGVLREAKASDALSSPAYSDYNTYLGMVNILELVSAGTRSVEATVSVYKLDGARTARVNVTIDPGQQQDIIINDLIGNRADTYGVVKIEFNSEFSTVELIGRMSYYRLNSDGVTYSFAFSRQINEPSTGTTYATSNSFDPQGRHFLVPNWLQVTNVSADARGFTVNLYNQSGSLVRSEAITLNSFERRDFAAGHEQGEGAYLNEVVPSDPATQYVAAATRYGSNSAPGTRIQSYAFAFALDTKGGTGVDQFSITANQTGDCFTQSNWVEVTNVAATAATATLDFYTNRGVLAGSSAVTLGSKAQFHFNGSVLIDERTYGSVKISSDTASALVAESVVYVHGCNTNLLQTAYVLPAVVPAAIFPINGSFNRFLEMQNDLLVVNVSAFRRGFDLTLSSGGAQLYSNSVFSNSLAVSQLNLNDETVFGTAADTYGTIEIDSVNPASFIAYNLRSRMNPAGTVDFVNATVFR
jgi:hypothetical protein